MNGVVSASCLLLNFNSFYRASCVLFCGEKFAKHSGVTVIWMSICLLERVGRDERRKEKETF
jgi:hypothetical protein